MICSICGKTFDNSSSVEKLINYCNDCLQQINFENQRRLSNERRYTSELKNKFISDVGLKNSEARLKDFEEINITFLDKLNQTVLIVGHTGTGKTYFASAIYYELLVNKDINCQYINLFELLRKYKKSIMLNEDDLYIDRLKKIKCLIIDEFSRLKSSATDLIFLFEIIDYRLKNEMFTLLICNFNLDNIKESLLNCFDIALADRLLSEDVLKLNFIKKRRN